MKKIYKVPLFIILYPAAAYKAIALETAAHFLTTSLNLCLQRPIVISARNLKRSSISSRIVQFSSGYR